MQVGWFLAPAIYGHCPQTVRDQPPCQAAGGKGKAVLLRGSGLAKNLGQRLQWCESKHSRPSA